MFISTNNNSQPRLKSAFTLIELLVVIVIIGILATLTTVSLTSARGKARDARRISDLKQIATALELYQADNNSYPTLITGGNSLVNPNDSSKVYMKKIPSDPSTNTSYAYYGSASRFTLRTTIEKSVDNIPVGPVIITNNSGARQALNTDNDYMNPDLTFGGTLVRHYALDGTTGANDLVGINTGTNYGASTSTGRFGEPSGAYLFDGSDDYVAIPLVSISAQSFTVTTWVQAIGDSLTGAIGYNTIITGRLLYGTNGNLLSQLTGQTNYASNIKAPRGQWNFIVYTYDLTNSTSRWYINSLACTEVTPVTITLSTNKIGSIGTAGYYMNGSMADFRVYSKALNASEITQLYNATRP